MTELQEIAESLGIDAHEWRSFNHCFTLYVNLREFDEYAHEQACQRLKPGGSRWCAALADLYNVILEEPHLYW